ncbi:MAG: hypothetical protein H6865_04350 [Rhodospirillales bacterium]|nr:hypothetical protein [Alphaproteobacteria bacterium]MCB9986849.1 hypothetical protein [Rhodospirillales bacterium]USO08389.1 MAG: hypothetical protein H6866_04030 [Rhodospirillales bacterium]
MKLSLRELVDRLGVGRELHAYETQPWIYVDSKDGITASAEVRMSGDGDTLEAELQFMYDTPPEGKSPVEQVMWLKARPLMRLEGMWATTDLWLRRENYANKVYNWEEKGCNFFRACVREIKAERLPDIDLLISRELASREVFGGGAGEGSNKSPQIKTTQLLYDMKNPHSRGF